MNREEAREYFNGLGLSYESINQLDLRKLSNILESELIAYLQNGSFQAKQMEMRVSSPRASDIKFIDGKLVRARIRIDGSYFKSKECIVFNKSGFIDFGGGLSDINLEPIFKAFCKWCDTLK